VIEFTLLPFEEAIAFFRNKVPMKPDQYRRLVDAAKQKAFTVTGTARMDVIGGMYSALEKAVVEGTTFSEFKKAAKSIMEKSGWEGMAPWRLDTVFRTNIQQAYQAGHYEQQKELAKERPYWQYVAVMDGRVRPSHAAMHGKTLAADDPFWQTSYPPNGFNCRCTVLSLSQSEFDREGGEVARKAGPIADPGFDRAPGETVFDKNAAAPGTIVAGQKTWKDYGRDDLRNIPDEARLPKPNLEPAASTQREAMETVMRATGLTEEIRFRTITTPIEDVIIHADRLPHMLEKRLEARERYANFILPTLTAPREIWLTKYADGWRRQYIGLFKGDHDMVAVVRVNRDGSILWNIMEAKDKKANKHREGIFIYGR
jgi:SPP1 gp7 family putative phage head morphogenesis protein